MKMPPTRRRTVLYTIMFVLYVIATLIDAVGLRPTVVSKGAMLTSLLCAMLTGYILIRSAYGKGASRG